MSYGARAAAFAALLLTACSQPASTPQAPAGDEAAAQMEALEQTLMESLGDGEAKSKLPKPSTPAPPRVKAPRPVPPAGAAVGRAKQSGEMELVFAGDVMLDRRVARAAKDLEGGYAGLFEYVKPYFERADAAFINLETTLSTKGKPWKNRNSFRAPPRAAQDLAAVGVEVACLGNNHTLDYGVAAVRETMAALRAAGVLYVGIAEQDKAQAPVVVEADGVKAAFLAYAPVIRPAKYAGFEQRPVLPEKEVVARDVAAAKKSADIVIVSMHWGKEGLDKPRPVERELGHYAIDQGAHVVVGHHPHVLQEPEFYKHGVILYSLGNFVFDLSALRNRKTRLYRLFVNKSGIAHIEFLPAVIDPEQWRPVPAAPRFVAMARPVQVKTSEAGADAF